VALCDVDDRHLAAAAKRFPQAKTYSDWRKMMEQKDLDAVVCSTTEHTHPLICAWALRRKLHVYCEKPIAHTPEEAQIVRQEYLKVKDKVATQQGTQIHAGDNFRRVVELIRSGAIGTVREVHNWCDRIPLGPRERPKDLHPVPPYLHWDLWLARRPSGPFIPPTSAAAACGGTSGGISATARSAAWARTSPTWVAGPWTLESPPPSRPTRIPKEDTPKSIPNGFRFAGISGLRRPAAGHCLLARWWQEAAVGRGRRFEAVGLGMLFIGDKGQLLSDYSRHVLLPRDKFQDYQPPSRRSHRRSAISGNGSRRRKTAAPRRATSTTPAR